MLCFYVHRYCLCILSEARTILVAAPPSFATCCNELATMKVITQIINLATDTRERNELRMVTAVGRIQSPSRNYICHDIYAITVYTITTYIQNAVGRIQSSMLGNGVLFFFMLLVLGRSFGGTHLL